MKTVWRVDTVYCLLPDDRIHWVNGINSTDSPLVRPTDSISLIQLG